MCHRHSFVLTRAGKVHDGLGFTDSHTKIREMAGVGENDSTTYAFEWQPPKGWPEADWNDGLTQDTAPFPHWELTKKHLTAIGNHLRSLYPDMDAWSRPDSIRLPSKFKGDLYLRGTAITALPEGLSVGGYLDLDCGSFSTVKRARAALAKASGQDASLEADHKFLGDL
jgi:hypothetical protein